jgi:hypothetical protein
MIEIDIPDNTVNLLYNHVLTNIGDRVLGEFPFYTKVTDNLLEHAFSNIVDLSCVSTGYIYAHDETIPLHVDRYKKDSIYNLNVPIYVEDKDQKFIVFDQEFTQCGCEWQFDSVKQKRHQPLTEDDLVNSKKDNDHLESICYTGKRPAETDGVIGLTKQSVNNDIVNDLPFDSEFYYGLSGKSWKQTPGKGLLFKSTQLHCTGKQTKFKIGCVLIMNSLGLLSNF